MSAENLTGAERITVERERQVRVHGWTTEHDQQHEGTELVDAALAYIAAARLVRRQEPVAIAPDPWPWEDRFWQPSESPVRNLEKAGALIAAEIDRLLADGEEG